MNARLFALYIGVAIPFFTVCSLASAQKSVLEIDSWCNEAVFSSCLQQETVLGGSFVDRGNPIASSTVFIEMLEPNGEKLGECSGVIIGRAFILTAGHCLPRRNMSVNVGFGLGGKAGFKHAIRSSLYYSSKAEQEVNEKGPEGPEQDSPSHEYLDFDKDGRRVFLEVIHRRNGFLNQNGRGKISEKNFLDFAVIKIDRLPPGYQPALPFQPVSLPFKAPAYVVGFGLNTRHLRRAQPILKVATEYAIGYASVGDRHPYAIELYSPDENEGLCSGDSGGPTFIEINGKLQLLGINKSGIEGCAGSGWISLPQSYRKFFERAASILGGSFAL
jgi:hypothetical protein